MESQNTRLAKRVGHNFYCQSAVSAVKYTLTKLDVRRDLITATAAISGMSSLVFGILTNLPVALA